jgi:hypothetical protein
VPEDAKVFVTHLRKFPGSSHLMTRHEARTVELYDGPPEPKGGLTIAQIEFADGSTVRASAQCNPKDTYNKAIGRMIAVGRAMKTAQKVGAV